MRRDKGKPEARSESAEWRNIRPAVAGALGSCAHRDCFLHGLRAVLHGRHGRAALQHRNGEPVAAQWRIGLRGEGEGERPVLGRRSVRCRDADLWGVNDLIFDGVDKGKLEVPPDASVRSRGDEVSTGASCQDMAQLCAKWRHRAEQWSATPGAGAALVMTVKDGRLVWVGVHVTRGPQAEFE